MVWTEKWFAHPSLHKHNPSLAEGGGEKEVKYRHLYLSEVCPPAGLAKAVPYYLSYYYYYYGTLYYVL